MKIAIKKCVCLGLTTLLLTISFPVFAGTNLGTNSNKSNSTKSITHVKAEEGYSLLNDGIKILELGRFQEAVQYWQKLANQFQIQENIINQA